MTPKGTKPARRKRPDAPARPPWPSRGRPTARRHGRRRATRRPCRQASRVSPPWVPVLMFGLLIVGALLIVLNYLELLPGGAVELYLLARPGLHPRRHHGRHAVPLSRSRHGTTVGLPAELQRCDPPQGLSTACGQARGVASLDRGDQVHVLLAVPGRLRVLVGGPGQADLHAADVQR